VNVAAFFLVAFLEQLQLRAGAKSGVELKARQDDIVQLEAWNEWIIRSITSGLITMTARRIILFNPAAEEIFGVRADEAIGRRIIQVLPGLDTHWGEMGQNHAGNGKDPEVL